MKEEIHLPAFLVGKSFYSELLPLIYPMLLNYKGKITFNMSDTVFIDPEGITNFLCLAAITKYCCGEIPKLTLPKNEEILSFLEKHNFFSIAKSQSNEVLDFVKYKTYSKYKINPASKVYAVFEHTNPFDITSNVNSILILLKKYFEITISLDNYLSFIINQTIRNIIEHNFEDNPIKTYGYYMAQKTPTNKFEFTISDFGKGLRNRISEMLSKDSADNIKYFEPYKYGLSNKKLLFESSIKNPNYVAIQAAVNYRKNTQKKPGLFQIKSFVNSLNGEFSVHSENMKIVYFSNGEDEYYYYDSFFNGCHIKIEIPLSLKPNVYED